MVEMPPPTYSEINPGPAPLPGPKGGLPGVIMEFGCEPVQLSCYHCHRQVTLQWYILCGGISHKYFLIRLWRMWPVRSPPQGGVLPSLAASSAPGWPPCWWDVSRGSGGSPTSVLSAELWLVRPNPVTLANTSLSSSSSPSWPLSSLDLWSLLEYSGFKIITELLFFYTQTHNMYILVS